MNNTMLGRSMNSKTTHLVTRGYGVGNVTFVCNGRTTSGFAVGASEALTCKACLKRLAKMGGFVEAPATVQ